MRQSGKSGSTMNHSINLQRFFFHGILNLLHWQVPCRPPRAPPGYNTYYSGVFLSSDHPFQVYYKVRQFFITKCNKCYYKVRQVLQSVTILLQRAIGIAKCDRRSLHLSRLAATVFTSSHDCHFAGSTHKKNLKYLDQNYTANFTVHRNGAWRHCAGP